MELLAFAALVAMPRNNEVERSYGHWQESLVKHYLIQLELQEAEQAAFQRGRMGDRDLQSTVGLP